MSTFTDRLRHAFNVFMNKDPTSYSYGSGSYIRPDRKTFSRGNERTIIASIYNRIALDAASINIKHVRLDENERFLETIDSGLNNCLNLEANLDQSGRAFLLDIFISLLDEGCIAIVPIDTSISIHSSNSFDILSMRTGKITDWYPDKVKIKIYNQTTGINEEVILPKKTVAIVENPLYSVINEPNSTMQRLKYKLALMDKFDEENGSKKLDLIIQLPYSIKGDLRRRQAEERHKDIENQLANSQYGIAYIDSTEHITQLNRPVENNLLAQIKYLTETLYGQLGLTPEIMNGSADEKTMLNYYNRTIEPLVSFVVDEMKRKFLTKTARTQHQTIMFFRDPFKLVPVNQIAEIADKFTRNEILTSNEVRQIVGIKPSNDPKADELRNKNLNQQNIESTDKDMTNEYK